MTGEKSGADNSGRGARTLLQDPGKGNDPAGVLRYFLTGASAACMRKGEEHAVGMLPRLLRAPVLFCLGFVFAHAGEPRWVATWATAPQLVEPGNLPPAPGFADGTLRQKLRTSIAGRTIRVRFSNAFGDTPLTLEAAQVALSAGDAAIRPESGRALTFHGSAAVTIQPGAMVISDAVALELPAMADVAVTVHTKGAPSDVTGHPGSRTTSYFAYGNAAVDAPDLPGAVRVDHWYLLTGIDVLTDRPAAAIAVLGDSITDGRGSTTNGNDRWTDRLSQRLRANPATADIAVLNLGLGGGRVLRHGLGPSAISRLDRDVIAEPGVKWLIILEGVNDIGGAVGARAKGEPAAPAAELIAAYEQIVLRAHDHGIRVYGGTITPLGGFKNYDTPESEADRQAVNAWIRTAGNFDGVIDFDAIARDPANPTHLSAATDGGDHLHPSAGGHKILAEGIELGLFDAAGVK
jgi:lysophospholipase L1-like esterase